MTKSRVSVVQYLNTIPLVWGMLHGDEQGRYELNFTVPSRCADDVRDGLADVGIIPSIEYQRIGGLEVVGGVSIASKQAVRSVLLLSNVPIERVGSVAADTSSRTSAALLTILLRKFYGLSPVAAAFEPDLGAVLRRADAALLIGDPALAYRGPVPYVYDLMAEWRKFTGLPFVFAFWAGPAGVPLRTLRQDFEASRDYGLAHMSEIAAECAARYNMTASDVAMYLTRNIDYTLDEENCRGLRLFFELAAEVGIIPGARELVLV